MKEPEPKQTAIELRVSVTDGSFDTCVRMPTNAPKGEIEKLTLAWLKLIEQAVSTTQALKPAKVGEEK